VASLVGSVIEWYDLFVYGSLAVVLAGVFFPSQNQSLSVLYALGAFVAGAAVRPLGGVIFGRLGDMVGRKYAFVLTVTVMGIGAVLTGLLPTYGEVGILAPILVVLVRIAQGLALGGEYGGATVYMAEYAPENLRGYWTSFIQAAPTLGLLLSSGVVLATRLYFGQGVFVQWGWRVPFLLSSLLLLFAVFVRLRLSETPVFVKLVEAGARSRTPLKDSLAGRANLRLILLALLVVSGSSVVWHTAQFYSTIFTQSVLHVDFATSATITFFSLALAAPFFVVFGFLSTE